MFQVILEDPYDPSVWRVAQRDKSYYLKDKLEEFYSVFPNKDTYIDIDHDDLGQRKYILCSNIYDYLLGKVSIK